LNGLILIFPERGLIQSGRSSFQGVGSLLLRTLRSFQEDKQALITL
jgi:hypothetical protein